MEKKASFTSQGKFISEPPKALYKGSLMQDLLPFKKNVFEKFPVKGLTFAGPHMKVHQDGSCMYEFASGEKHDKVVFRGIKDGSLDLIARHRKKEGNYDVTIKKKIADHLVLLTKVEEKGSDRDLVVGLAYTGKDCKADVKAHPMEFASVDGRHVDVKGSFIYTAPWAKQFSLGGDVALGVAKMVLQKYTVGAAYKISNDITAGVSYNHDKMVTLDLHSSFKKHDVDVGAEIVYNPKPLFDSKYVWMMAAVWKYDQDHVLKTKLNSNWQLAISVNKVISKQLSVTTGTLVHLKRPQRFFSNMGFKVSLKA